MSAITTAITIRVVFLFCPDAVTWDRGPLVTEDIVGKLPLEERGVAFVGREQLRGQKRRYEYLNIVRYKIQNQQIMPSHQRQETLRSFLSTPDRLPIQKVISRLENAQAPTAFDRLRLRARINPVCSAEDQP